jgi:hypothetical protein
LFFENEKNESYQNGQGTYDYEAKINALKIKKDGIPNNIQDQL